MSDEYKSHYSGANRSMLERCLDDRDARIAELEGAMLSDDKRLEEAAIRVYGEHRWGCDTPEHLADSVLGLRAHIANLEARLAAWEPVVRWAFDLTGYLYAHPHMPRPPVIPREHWPEEVEK